MVTRQPGYESYAVLHIGRLCENVRENPEGGFQRIITQSLIKKNYYRGAGRGECIVKAYRKIN
jgi:hypothetical protein